MPLFARAQAGFECSLLTYTAIRDATLGRTPSRYRRGFQRCGGPGCAQRPYSGELVPAECPLRNPISSWLDGSPPIAVAPGGEKYLATLNDYVSGCDPTVMRALGVLILTRTRAAHYVREACSVFQLFCSCLFAMKPFIAETAAEVRRATSGESFDYRGSDGCVSERAGSEEVLNYNSNLFRRERLIPRHDRRPRAPVLHRPSRPRRPQDRSAPRES
ncbi:hypothetical protein EVAR_94501_1 [Eumeta japonica]|uniref:Uncharacterized protein n=1 Tax=Eumeta variegata TaxID=151549 RepID=A0A4C1UUL9_EUMVA|nr:hypothetical protein EVAR_94501_1 [Eumeta japonica]